MTNKIWTRRSLMSGMSAVAAAFALGARPASAQTAAAAFQPARHPQDKWLDKIPWKHRVVFDVTSSRGVPEALHFANNIYSGNKSMYGLDEADLAVFIVLRHSATAFGYSDAIWAKHGKALAAATSYTDPKSSESLKVNPFKRDPDRNNRRDGQARRAVRRLRYGPATTSRAGSRARVEMPMQPTRRWSPA